VTIVRRRPSCARHRAALLDFVDGRERARDDEALAHLDACRSCEDELVEIALAITALRRIRADAERVEPSPDAWERLRPIAARREAPPWRWHLSLGATVMGAALAAIVAMPLAFGRLTAPGAPIAGDGAPWAVDRPLAAGAGVTRAYDPPAGLLTARVVTLLAGEQGIGRARDARLLTLRPGATDRAELERRARWAQPATSQPMPTRAGTPD
jgi:hypothetical protein